MENSANLPDQQGRCDEGRSELLQDCTVEDDIEPFADHPYEDSAKHNLRVPRDRPDQQEQRDSKLPRAIGHEKVGEPFALSDDPIEEIGGALRDPAHIEMHNSNQCQKAEKYRNMDRRLDIGSKHERDLTPQRVALRSQIAEPTKGLQLIVGIKA